jgi:tetratricopeptide (TPR) repeat protein
MGSPDRIDPLLAADIDRLATTFATDPRSKAFMPLAEAYIKAGMWREAAGVLEDGLAVYPGFVTAMAALGRVYDQLGQPAKAKAILENVVKQSPENLRAHRILAKIFCSEGHTDSALKSCAAILAVNADDEEALSIQQAITGRSSDDQRTLRAKREKRRLTSRPEEHAGPGKEPVSAGSGWAGKNDYASPATPAKSVVPDMPKPTESLPASVQVAKSEAVVARLEAWLQTIQSRRQTTPR